MDVSRRKFFKICAGGMAGTTAAALGFAPKMALAQARNFKLLRAKEIRKHLHLLLRGLRAINV
ncbi:molybdopterin oxidoreductase Fe4S4 region [Klebsiella pneumoniae]|uniref:Molybdopterin oxidoreductase Fe4S4 region n=1 Tax=Klebsiella pneumoniae TaxID=573 RepID=A0A377WIJ6_KLEPN|nr:molybdopterin oxidoreductase Fe4S4 region [Klebsiella pneumoniae]